MSPTHELKVHLDSLIAFTPNVKSILSENVGGILGGILHGTEWLIV
jgi:hypothetical protein